MPTYRSVIDSGSTHCPLLGLHYGESTSLPLYSQMPGTSGANVQPVKRPLPASSFMRVLPSCARERLAGCVLTSTYVSYLPTNKGAGMKFCFASSWPLLLF